MAENELSWDDEGIDIDEEVSEEDVKDAESMGKVAVGRYFCDCVASEPRQKDFKDYSCIAANLRWEILKVLELDGVRPTALRFVKQLLRLLDRALVVVADLGDHEAAAVVCDSPAVDRELAHVSLLPQQRASRLATGCCESNRSSSRINTHTCRFITKSIAWYSIGVIITSCITGISWGIA